jgi:acetylornithine deacetylase
LLPARGRSGYDTAMQRVDAEIASQARDILARLVAFDTTSAKSNLDLIAWVESYLAQHGVSATRTPSPSGSHASLHARIGEGDGGVGLSGHTDCVPVTGQNWLTDPFVLTERDGRLYGRGTCDMKGFLACALAAVPDFAAREAGPPIDLLFSYDEEVGCTGVRPMIARLGRDLPRPDLVIVGEPTSMEVVDAHKSIDAYVTQVTGREAHSSMPQLGANAIRAAASLIGELGRIEDAFAARDDGARFDPPFATLQVGTIKGGVAGNIVPRECSFRWQVRALPGCDAGEAARLLASYAEREALPKLRARYPEAAIETRHTNNVPAFGAGPASPAVTLALRLAGRNESFAVSYGTEAGLFEAAGVAAAISGPGDIAQAHAANEFVEMAQLRSCLAFMGRLGELR